MVLRIKNFSTLGVHWKIRFFGCVSRKINIEEGDCLKRGPWSVCRFKGGLGKKMGECFWSEEGWYPNAHYGGQVIECLLLQIKFHNVGKYNYAKFSCYLIFKAILCSHFLIHGQQKLILKLKLILKPISTQCCTAIHPENIRKPSWKT